MKSHEVAKSAQGVHRAQAMMSQNRACQGVFFVTEKGYLET